MMAAYWID